MSDYFLDSSALAKRYLSEAGTAWVRGLVEPAAGHAIWVAEITQVEVAAALAARQRAPGGITRQERDRAVRLLLRHTLLEYRLVSTTPALIRQALDLTQRHRLRGYDAVQLATALAAHGALLAAGLPGPTFVAADADLLAAARAAGLAADDPNLHR
ncbi:MAG TPA: type II toxin-antitoxin system VapC family toxin [Thermomicrobiales bacterium]|nr:type II toxin-antitoxin system VapC family toxin [Thermomicrobiales bacterium]